jgi:Endoplasmic Reticulum Oxidoreductin 1 (ERO1)
VLSCPQWIENLYFNYVVVLRAVTKLSDYLGSYTYCSGDPTQDEFTKQKVHSLIAAAQIAAPSFDESRMFDPSDSTIIGLKDEFRERFRNVSRVMDCVGCDKCRLWGKVQTGGYGTALKVLFEFDPHQINGDFHLRRTELVSLIVTLQRLSHSIWAVERFGEMCVDPIPPRPVTVKDKVLSYLQCIEFKPFAAAFDEEFREIFLAVQFILKSYLLLPINLWRVLVTFMAGIWDRYVIGNTVFERGGPILTQIFE